MQCGHKYMRINFLLRNHKVHLAQAHVRLASHAYGCKLAPSVIPELIVVIRARQWLCGYVRGRPFVVRFAVGIATSTASAAHHRRRCCRARSRRRSGGCTCACCSRATRSGRVCSHVLRNHRIGCIQSLFSKLKRLSQVPLLPNCRYWPAIPVDCHLRLCHVEPAVSLLQQKIPF